jgi:hypothetical protein
MGTIVHKNEGSNIENCGDISQSSGVNTSIPSARQSLDFIGGDRNDFQECIFGKGVNDGNEG